MFYKVFSTLILAAVLIGPSGSVVNATSKKDHNPKGNNGTIKISEESGFDGIPNNDPHVSCEFYVEFFNYDKGDYNADVDFKMHAPTNKSEHSIEVVSGNLNPFIGGDEAGGGKDLDAREKYRLEFEGEPHHKQGYHVKVKVNAPGSYGSGKKQKVFWVQPCEDGEVLSDVDEKDADKDEKHEDKPAAPVEDDGKGGESDFEPKTLSTSTEKVADDEPGKGGALPATGANTVAASALIALSVGLLSYFLHYKFSNKENAFQL